MDEDENAVEVVGAPGPQGDPQPRLRRADRARQRPRGVPLEPAVARPSERPPAADQHAQPRRPPADDERLAGPADQSLPVLPDGKPGAALGGDQRLDAVPAQPARLRRRAHARARVRPERGRARSWVSSRRSSSATRTPRSSPSTRGTRRSRWSPPAAATTTTSRPSRSTPWRSTHWRASIGPPSAPGRRSGSRR